MHPAPAKKIYAILPEITAHNFDAIQIKIKELLAQHINWFQYRNKNNQPRNNQYFLRQIQKQIKQNKNTILIVNDDADLALKNHCDGLHIGIEDGSIARIRKKIGPKLILGISCYQNIQRAEMAQQLHANYVSFGVLFPSHTKPKAHICSTNTILLARKKIHIPVVLIGGICQHHIPHIENTLQPFAYAISHDLFKNTHRPHTSTNNH